MKELLRLQCALSVLIEVFFPLINAQYNHLCCYPVKSCCNPHEWMMLERAPVSCHLSALSYMGSREILKAGDLEEKILLFSWDVAHMSMYDNSVLFSYMCLQRHKWHNTELVRGTWMPSWCLITGKCSLEMSQGILWIPQLAFSAVSASLPLRCCDLIHCPVPKCCVQFSALPSKDDLAIVSLGQS